jgi:hypothetical protein
MNQYLQKWYFHKHIQPFFDGTAGTLQVENMSSFLLGKYMAPSNYITDTFDHIDSILNRTLSCTPLMKAVTTKYNTQDIVDILIQDKCTINKKDELGRTALMYVVTGAESFGCCSMPGKEICTRILLKFGADRYIKDNYGMTALDYFRIYIKDSDYPNENHPAILLLDGTK